MAVDDNSFFTWGRGGRKMSPEDIQALLALEERERGIDVSPVGHWTQGLARVANAAAGSFRRGQLEKQQGENDALNEKWAAPLLKALAGGSSDASSGSTIPMPAAAGEVAATSPSGGPQNYRDAIASIESAGSGDYAAVGPTHPKLGRALGRYQVMEANIGPWSEKYLGRRITPEEFIQNPEYQDAIFDGEFGSYVNKFGPEGAAQAWFGGEGGVGKLDRKDSLGTTIGEYGSRFMNAVGGVPVEVASLSPEAAIEAVAPASPLPVEAMPLAPVDGVDVTAPTPGPVAPMSMLDPARADTPAQSFQPRMAPEMAPPVDVGMAPGMNTPVQAAPVEVAGGGGRMADFAELNPVIMQALTDPRANQQTQRLAMALLQRQQEQQDAQRQAEIDAADPRKQLELRKLQAEVDALGQPKFNQLTPEQVADAGLDPTKQYQRGADGKISQIGDSGTSVTVNTGEGEGKKFYDTLDAKGAETLAALQEGGVNARSKMGQINRLEQLLSQSPQGAEAGVKQWLGDLGINTEGLDSIQATRALLERMVPEQRAPGSGPMSDADIAMFRNSLPRLINQPGGNSMVLNTMRAIATYEMQMGEIADRVMDREIKPADARKMIRDLKNPLEGIQDAMKGSNAPAGGLPEGITQEEWDVMPEEDRRLFQ